MAIGLSIIAALEGFGVVLLGIAIFGLGFGLLFPAATALVADGTNVEERGGAFGMFYAVYSFGVVIGTFASGFIMDIFGDSTRLPFAFATGMVLVGGIILITVSSRFKSVNAESVFAATPEFVRKTKNS
jgi:MFS family permease